MRRIICFWKQYCTVSYQKILGTSWSLTSKHETLIQGFCWRLFFAMITQRLGHLLFSRSWSFGVTLDTSLFENSYHRLSILTQIANWSDRLGERANAGIGVILWLFHRRNQRFYLQETRVTTFYLTLKESSGWFEKLQTLVPLLHLEKNEMDSFERGWLQRIFLVEKNDTLFKNLVTKS